MSGKASKRSLFRHFLSLLDTFWRFQWVNPYDSGKAGKAGFWIPLQSNLFKGQKSQK